MLNTETLLSLEQAADRLPNKPSYVTVWRWCCKGIQGTYLEHRRLGRVIYTSAEALERFTLALADARRQAPAVRREHTRRRAPSSEKESAWADAVLADAFGHRGE